MVEPAKGLGDPSAEVAQLDRVAPALGLRVQEILGVSSLAGAKVLAGAAGLDRIVRYLNVMEVPDILPWVKPNELLLTTGYPLREDPQALVGLVGELDNRGLAALAIKLHRYLDEVPAAMLAEADRRGFPILEVPPDAGFADVLNEVHGELLNRQAAVLARSEEVHRALVSVVLDGGDLTDLATELTRLLGGPALITTPDGRVLARAGEIPTGFDPSGRFLVESEGEHTVVPIVAGRVDHGRIVAFPADPRTPLTDADVHHLERAATVAALAITKKLAVAAVESKYQADFLRDLLAGRVDDLPAAVTHARAFGWEIDRPSVVVVAELDPDAVPPATSAPQLRPIQERFAAAWQGVVRWRDPQAAVVNFNREVVVLLGLPADGDIDRLVAELVRLVKGDGGGGRRSFSLGVSRAAAAPQELAQAYEQARAAVRIGRRLHGNGARASFDRLGVHRLLSLIEDGEELRGFVADVLGELVADNAENADLRHTLAVLLETNCNVAETARRLHFHYNTLRYRIGKLERTVGPFTTDAMLRLDLMLALRVLEIRGL
ncbi:PucR family transcriptional regulator [Micromonospora sp. WMMD558]|uniref:PucR family transcriptional regulator n=1 Tax=unclassified Micromonospora TaxID=2617518 RepID=UPI0012B46489|nr:PucR family transcriptional regulator [Micromonospora sp. WMMC415]QGN48035.1 PucR family transcriptional regulator [Micromonospora sp. WMMC415]